MSVELKELVPGAIAVCANGSLAIITGYNPRSEKYTILYKLKTGTRGYKGGVIDFKVVIGMADLDKYKEAEGPSVEKPKVDVPEFLKPDILKGVEIGDTIEIRERGRIRKVIYQGYKPNRPKNPLSFSLPSGGMYKAPISLLVGKVEENKVVA